MVAQARILPAFFDEIDSALGSFGSSAHAGEKGGVFSHEFGTTELPTGAAGDEFRRAGLASSWF
jgi:hypothetical protein